MADDGVPNEASGDHFFIRGWLSGLSHKRALKSTRLFAFGVALKAREAAGAA